MPPYFKRENNAPGRTRTCGPLLSFQHQAFPDRPLLRVCWLDYILDITVPTRIVSEESKSQTLRSVSCGLPNPQGLLLTPVSALVPEALRAFPHIGPST